MPTPPKEIRLYHEADGSCPYAKWYLGLKDKKTQAIIDYRLSRVEAGTLGDCKALGKGIYELRIHHGPGWRIYFAQVGNTVILLLCGSDKSSQQQSIRKAKAFWKDYQQRMEDPSMSKRTSQKQTSYEDLIADNLRDPEYLQNYLTLCFNDPDPNVFLVALRRVARANNVNFTQLAKELNLSRQGLYKSLSEEGNPPWSTLHALFKILGFEVSIIQRVS